MEKEERQGGERGDRPREDERACDLAGLAGGAGGNPSFLARVSTVLAPELSCRAGGGRDTGPTSCIFDKILICGQTSNPFCPVSPVGEKMKYQVLPLQCLHHLKKVDENFGPPHSTTVRIQPDVVQFP